MASYTDSIFINCPFDDNYREIFWAITFTIYRCGFFPRCSLEEDNAADARFDKIQRLIKQCKYGIHDISNTDLDAHNDLPRFNMPLELGLFLGAKKYGDKKQKSKAILIFERIRYRYQQYISDLNGIDPKAHNDNYTIAIEHTRNWLQSQSRRKTIVGHAIIISDFNDFIQNVLPLAVLRVGLDINNLNFNDYSLIVEEHLSAVMA